MTETQAKQYVLRFDPFDLFAHVHSNSLSNVVPGGLLVAKAKAGSLEANLYVVGRPKNLQLWANVHSRSLEDLRSRFNAEWLRMCQRRSMWLTDSQRIKEYDRETG